MALRIPQHRVDSPGHLILPTDSAWDSARIDAELEALVAAKLAEVKAAAVAAAAAQAGVSVEALAPELREAAEASCALTQAEENEARAKHPVARYHQGATRFQLDTPDQGPDGPTCARAYLRPDGAPVMFELRRVPWRVRASIEAEPDRVARWEAWCREGIAAVMGDASLAWRAKAPGEQLPARVIDALCESPGSYLNLIPLAAAVMKYSEPLRPDEVFPSAS